MLINWQCFFGAYFKIRRHHYHLTEPPIVLTMGIRYTIYKDIQIHPSENEKFEIQWSRWHFVMLTNGEKLIWKIFSSLRFLRKHSTFDIRLIYVNGMTNKRKNHSNFKMVYIICVIFWNLWIVEMTMAWRIQFLIIIS